MSNISGRLIGGAHHGEPFEVPLSAENMAVINSGSRYTGVMTVPPGGAEPYTYLVSTDLIESGQYLDFIRANNLWDWGAPPTPTRSDT